MGEPFKEWINAASVQRLADQLHAHHPSFARQSFTDAATTGLEALELKGRVRHVARALRRALPAHWPDALAILCAGMGPPLTGTEKVSINTHLWPVLQTVEDDGLAHPQASLAALRELTRRFTAEFAVRPYLMHHPEVAWPILASWANDPDVHVRRLASEGSRPRLPWGRRLRGTTQQGLAVIECLKDDPERYVQKSVANHLNDVSREDPAQMLATARRWAEGAGPGRMWIVRHALRSRTKAGDAEALAILGFEHPDVCVGTLSISQAQIAIGETLRLSANITARHAQKLMVDVVLGLKRQKGQGQKVFRGGQRTLQPGETWTWTHALSMRPVTTRRYYPGHHTVCLQINGVKVATKSFTLTTMAAGTSR